MAKKKSGNKMWITGAVLGAVAGAAYALWKTPMSGQELRSKLSTGPVDQQDAVSTDAVRTPSAADRLLGKVEQTLAPIVGVQLGKTANGPAPVHDPVTGPISVATPPVDTAAETEVSATHEEHTAMTKTDKDPKFNAADATPDPGRNTDQTGSDSIRAKRFAWGSPTPEAGVQPVPTEPMEEDPVTEPAIAREPAAPAQMVPPGDSNSGSDTIRSKRFSWGEPAPDKTTAHDNVSEDDTGESQPRTDQLATAGATTAGGSRPVEAVSEEASVHTGKKRDFPKLGGLENS